MLFIAADEDAIHVENFLETLGKPRLFVFINILLKAADLMLGKSCVWVEKGETKSLILKLWVSIVFPQTTQLAIVLLGIRNFIIACRLDR